MNNIQEAIVWIKDLQKEHAVTAHWWGACDTAILALQEKANREKGCEYCDPDNVYYYYAGNLPNYCKHCGRKLK